MRTLTLSLLLMLAASAALAQVPAGSAITYQGELNEEGTPLDGAVDLIFTLWDDLAGGLAVGTPIQLDSVAVADGVFTAQLDFGEGAFAGEARWLGIQVRSPHDPSDSQPFTLLDPRQAVTAAPYALHALNAEGHWEAHGSAIVNTNTGFVGINRDYTVGLEWFGVHAPVNTGYGGMYVTTEGATAWPFYGYRAGGGGQTAWTYLDGGDGDWHVSVDGTKLTVRDEGQVGIGIMEPTEKLHVNGVVYSQSGGFKFPDGTLQATAAVAAGGITLDAAYDEGGPGAGRSITADAGAVQILGSDGLTVEANNSGAGFSVDQNSIGAIAQFFAAGSPTVTIDNVGRLGVGTTVPNSELDVRAAETYGAAINLERTSAAGSANDIVQIRAAVGSDPFAQLIEAEIGSTDPKFRVWMDGDVTADGTLTGGGADFAEAVRVSAGAASVEAGDVMVIDPAATRGFARSAAARSTLVAGVYSTRPGVLASSHDWDQKALEIGMLPPPVAGEESPAIKPLAVAARLNEVPLAVIGIVPCKASAENGPIAVGDLLVTAATPGHAMRADNPGVGTVLGKALAPLASGTGVIEIMVTLQ
jgi:hypothetical protein